MHCVSRRFSATFGPVLYRECDIWTTRKLFGMRRCSHIAHTERFSLRLPPDGYSIFDFSNPTSAPELIRNMSALEIFEWAGQPLSPDVPQAPKSCGSLKSVHIMYSEEIEKNIFEPNEIYDGGVSE